MRNLSGMQEKKSSRQLRYYRAPRLGSEEVISKGVVGFMGAPTATRLAKCTK